MAIIQHLNGPYTQNTYDKINAIPSTLESVIRRIGIQTAPYEILLGKWFKIEYTEKQVFQWSNCWENR